MKYGSSTGGWVIVSAVYQENDALCTLSPLSTCCAIYTHLHTIAHTCVYINICKYIFTFYAPFSLCFSLFSPFFLPPSSLSLFLSSSSFLSLSLFPCLCSCMYCYVSLYCILSTQMYLPGYTLLAAFVYIHARERVCTRCRHLNLLISSGVSKTICKNIWRNPTFPAYW